MNAPTSALGVLASGEKVILRTRVPSDVDVYVHWRTHGEWRHWDAPWEGVEDSLTPEEESEYRERFSSSFEGKPPFPRTNAVITTSDGQPLGWVNRYSPKDYPDEWYVGIDICEDEYLNRGMGTEALRLWVDYLFENSDVHRIGLDTWSFNQRMMRVAEKIGFVCEGAQRELREWQGERTDGVHYGMLRREWEARGAAAGAGTTDPEACELYLKGRLLLDQRTVEAYERSRRLFEEAIARDPSYPLPYTGLAEAFIRLNNIHRLTPQEARLGAMRAASRALELGPGLAETHVALGRVRWDFEDDTGSAEAAFRRAIELSPGHARAHMMLAHLLERTDRPEEALEEAERALRLDPMSASLRHWMVHFKARLRDWRGAVDLLKENVDLYPADAVSHSGYGYFVASLGRSKEGSEHMRRALELDPANPSIRELSAIVLLRQGEFEKALGEAQKLIDGSPSDHDGHALTGEALMGLSRYEEAIAAFSRAKEAIRAHDPEGHPSAQFIAGIDGMLGIAYARQGDIDRGEEVLRDLIERSETGPVARSTLAALSFALGKADEGFAWLREACQRTESIVVALRTSPWLDDARSDPRFAEILETVGLADYPPDEQDS